jgi:hypothetical protein
MVAKVAVGMPCAARPVGCCAETGGLAENGLRETRIRRSQVGLRDEYATSFPETYDIVEFFDR